MNNGGAELATLGLGGGKKRKVEETVEVDKRSEAVSVKRDKKK